MSSREEMLAEAHRRGLMSPEVRAAYEEAQRRGILGDKAPLAVRAGQQIREIPRQLGLTARYGLEAFGQTALPDMIGLPEPQFANERVIGDASRTLIQSVPIAKGAQLIGGAMKAGGAAQGIFNTLGTFNASTAASAAGAGIGGGAVREAGGSELEQMGGAVLGGLAAPAVLGLGKRAVDSAWNAGRKLLAPKDVESVVKVELQRAGINWDELTAQARSAIVKDAEKSVYAGQPIDGSALRRLADYRNVGATPLVGDITQDPRALTAQRNLTKQLANTNSALGGPDLPGIENQNARRVISTLEGMGNSKLDTYGTGLAITDRVRNIDSGLKTRENALYRAARGTDGRQVPLDRHAFVNEAFDNLTQINRGGWLPDQVRGLLNDIAAGKAPFTVDTIDNLKTLLAQESRSSTNGNVRAAVGAVRGALENVRPEIAKRATGSPMPIPGAVGARVAAADAFATNNADDSLKAFDQARRFARSRREWQESAKFIEEALDGAEPDKFVQKHIIGGSVEDLAKIRKLVNSDKELHEAVKKQLLEHIMTRGRVDGDTVKFSSAGMNDALKQLGERKLGLFFDKQELQQIRSAINVGRYMQSQPIGSAVNNSNTAAMVWGRLSDILLKGKAIPIVGPMVAEPVRGLTLSMQGRAIANTGNALAIPAPREPVPLNSLLLTPVIPRRKDDGGD